MSVLKQTILQKKALIFSFNFTPWKWLWLKKILVTPKIFLKSRFHCTTNRPKISPNLVFFSHKNGSLHDFFIMTLPSIPRACTGEISCFLMNFSSNVNWPAQKSIADTTKRSPRTAFWPSMWCKPLSENPTVVRPAWKRQMYYINNIVICCF